MARKRLTQVFPFLLPLRVWQKKSSFYFSMWFDGRRYSRVVESGKYPFCIFDMRAALINPATGFDMIYQENKVHNLKLAAGTLNGLLIKPGETFSFWQRVRHAAKTVPYRDGLILADGKLTTAPGGGLCQMSNMLYWCFLNSPLAITERHPHSVKPFPTPGMPEGADATVYEGWRDLKAKNNTDMILQIGISFDAESILVGLYAKERLQ